MGLIDAYPIPEPKSEPAPTVTEQKSSIPEAPIVIPKPPAVVTPTPASKKDEDKSVE